MKKLIVLALVAASMTGCVNRIATMSVASTQDFDLNKSSYVEGNRVTATEQKHIVLVPLGQPSIDEATAKAMAQDKCTVALTDMHVKHGFLHILVLPFGTNWFSVEGTQVIDTSLPGCEHWNDKNSK